MDKSLIKAELTRQVQSKLDELNQTVGATRSHANDTELKPDGKYDTRATEAKYLADALAKKASDLELDLQLLDKISLSELSEKDEIAMGALVELEHNGRRNFYFLGPISGGSILMIEGKSVLVISIFSPLGAQLIGNTVGEEVVVETPSGDKIYSVLSIK